MARLDDDQRWMAMIWGAHTQARAGDFTKANALLDLVQVQASTRSERVEEDPTATNVLHAAIELRHSLHAMARR
ncbi:MAG TPA: hypothetical protein RMH99_09620 [Sandaracinaceae bacterium LLY-WYZ-13_1]|nr:hypothetical protein [Sandaracinaceae bacterium LLY-WYZ-13_1]